jgi:hypothetical protein
MLQLIIGVLFVEAGFWPVVITAVNWHDVFCI